jgi:hypothetical protein
MHYDCIAQAVTCRGHCYALDTVYILDLVHKTAYTMYYTYSTRTYLTSAAPFLNVAAAAKLLGTPVVAIIAVAVAVTAAALFTTPFALKLLVVVACWYVLLVAC